MKQTIGNSLYRIIGGFYTDGDYSIRIDNFDEKYRNAIKYNEGEDSYRIMFQTEDFYDAQCFLEQLAVSIDVLWTHYYILPELYGMVKKVIDSLKEEFGKTEPKFIFEEVLGNYEGTELKLIIT